MLLLRMQRACSQRARTPGPWLPQARWSRRCGERDKPSSRHWMPNNSYFSKRLGIGPPAPGMFELRFQLLAAARLGVCRVRLRNRREYLTRLERKTAAYGRNSTVCVKYLHKTTKNLTSRTFYAFHSVFWKIFPPFRPVTHNILWVGFPSPFFKNCQTEA